MFLSKKIIAATLLSVIAVFMFAFAHSIVPASAQVSPTPATTPANNGSPIVAGMPCGPGQASPTSSSTLDDISITSGNSFWKCRYNPITLTYGWQAPFSSPVVATATTGTFASQSYVLGGCTATQTVTITGASVGTNSATASPIFTSAPSGNVALLNITAWVSAANTVSVQGCAFGVLGTTPSFSAKVLLY